MKLLIIIPTYNEEMNICGVIEELNKKSSEYDYIIVNDGSSDSTREICKRNNYSFLDLPVNVGLSSCFQTGVIYAYNKGYDAVLQLDGDGQHDPEYIKDMIRVMEETGCDIVIGSRFVSGKKSEMDVMKRIGSSLISACILITTGKRVKDPTSGMRLYNRSVMSRFKNDINCHPEPDTLSYLISKGAKVKEVQVSIRERLYGKSYLDFSNSIKYMLKMCVSILFVQAFR